MNPVDYLLRFSLSILGALECGSVQLQGRLLLCAMQVDV